MISNSLKQEVISSFNEGQDYHTGRAKWPSRTLENPKTLPANNTLFSVLVALSIPSAKATRFTRNYPPFFIQVL